MHGRSIGGVAACHLASHHTDVVRMLVADRAFGRLQTVACHSMGKWAEIGLKMAMYDANNTQNYCAATQCPKLMLYDPADCVVPDISSLRTFIAKQTMKDLHPSKHFQLSQADAIAFLQALDLLILLLVEYEADAEPEPS